MEAQSRIVLAMSLSIIWLLVSHNVVGPARCEAAQRGGDFDANRQQQQHQQDLNSASDQLSAYGQLENASDAARRLGLATTLTRPWPTPNRLREFNCKKLIDNYRELLFMLTQQQRQQQSAQEQRAAEEDALRLLQLIGPDYEIGDERLEVDKKAGAKHTPRFG